MISGTPLLTDLDSSGNAKTYSFVVKVTDSQTPTAAFQTGSFSITINPLPVVTSTTLPDGTIGLPLQDHVDEHRRSCSLHVVLHPSREIRLQRRVASWADIELKRRVYFRHANRTGAVLPVYHSGDRRRLQYGERQRQHYDRGQTSRVLLPSRSMALTMGNRSTLWAAFSAMEMATFTGVLDQNDLAGGLLATRHSPEPIALVRTISVPDPHHRRPLERDLHLQLGRAAERGLEIHPGRCKPSASLRFRRHQGTELFPSLRD